LTEISQDAASVTPDSKLLQKVGETRHLRAPTKILKLAFQTRGQKRFAKVPAQKDRTSGIAIYASNNTAGKLN
jgi:hypothetical protein